MMIAAFRRIRAGLSGSLATDSTTAHRRPLRKAAGGSLGCLLLCLAAAAEASPPACLRDDAARFAFSEAVVGARLLASKRRDVIDGSVALSAIYRVVESFKGDLEPGAKLALVSSCRAGEVPMGQSGPLADPRRYCSNTDYWLPGVDPETGRGREGTADLVIFLEHRVERGETLSVWAEFEESGYDRCRAPAGETPPGLVRLRARAG